MKNFINYYYNFNVHDIYFSNGKYFFNVGHDKYMLKQIYNTTVIDAVAELSKQIDYIDQYFFRLVSNKDGSYLTSIDGKVYVVMWMSNIKNDKMTIFDIKSNNYVNLTTKVSTLNRFNWIQLWEQKIDYFEELVFSKQDAFKKIFPLFYYFVGIAENALLYMKEAIKEESQEETDRLVLSHRRLTIDWNLHDYYDITNVIIDHPCRDVSEYIKSMFLNREWDIEVLREYLNKVNFSKFGIRVLLARTMFPSFFFDYIEKMLTENSEIDLLYLETRANEFQLFLKELNVFLSETYQIPGIAWLMKKM